MKRFSDIITRESLKWFGGMMIFLKKTPAENFSAGVFS